MRADNLAHHHKSQPAKHGTVALILILGVKSGAIECIASVGGQVIWTHLFRRKWNILASQIECDRQGEYFCLTKQQESKFNISISLQNTQPWRQELPRSPGEQLFHLLLLLFSLDQGCLQYYFGNGGSGLVEAFNYNQPTSGHEGHLQGRRWIKPVLYNCTVHVYRIRGNIREIG